MKRTLSINLLPTAKRTRSCTPVLVNGIDIQKRDFPWVSPSKLRNYMLKDALSDWYSKHESHHNFSNQKFDKVSNFKKQMGIRFERKVFDFLIQRELGIEMVSTHYSRDNVKITENLMKQGVPFLYQASLCNPYNRTYGVADLLVRSDYLDQLVTICPLSEQEKIIPARKLGTPYHYVVVDIKASNLTLNSDGKHLRNSGSFPAFKAQLWIYNRALGHLQGYHPRCAYVLGRSWKYTKGGETFQGSNCLDRLGTIDFFGWDQKYIEETRKATYWYRDLLRNGHKMDPKNPCRDELRPNMCVDSGIWNKRKKELAESAGDITLLYYCGIKHRKQADSQGIKSFRDPACCSEAIGMNGKRAKLIDSIIDINRQDQDLIRPGTIRNDLFNWKNGNVNEFFVDFEVFNDIFDSFDELPHKKRTDMIFLIGVGYIDNGIWQYKNFRCERPTLEEEYRIMQEFMDFINLKNHPKLWFWHAEVNFWRRYAQRQADRITSSKFFDDIVNSLDWKWYWADLKKVFEKTPITIKGCYKFKLKEIASQMVKHRMITTKLDTNCQNGFEAMVEAWEYYKGAPGSNMDDIVKYNEWDCKVLWDMLRYLRENHI